MSDHLAGLPMYDFPELRDATDAFWVILAKELRSRGFDDIPAHLTRQHDLPSLWSDDRLVFGQTCGYPLSIGMCGKAQIVATPVYNAPRCDGPRYGSVLIVPARSNFFTLADLQGTKCAVNASDSNTGMNLLRGALADIGAKAPFFAQVIETHAHRTSLAWVAKGDAQLAAIDVVSFAHFNHIAPDLTKAVRVIGETRKTLGLPFITSSKTSAEGLAILRGALKAVVEHEPRYQALDRLFITGFQIMPDHAYDEILALEADAAARSYPKLA